MSSAPTRAPSDLAVEELASWLAGQGLKPAHAPRLLRQLDGLAGESSGWRLPVGLMERLRADFPGTATLPVRRQVAEDGTTKLLLRLHDGRTVESVLMPDYHPGRAAGCVSSQVGCAMG